MVAAMTVSRRGVCGALAGLAALPLANTASSALAAGSARDRPDIRYVLTDARHPESVQFAAIFERMGVARLEVTEGLTKLWREALVPHWQEKGGAIAGLTRREAWECVAEQARSCHRRSMLTGHHVFSAEGTLRRHMLSAPPSALAGAAALDRCGAAWPSVMADIAARCPTIERPAACRAQFGVPAPAADVMHGAELVSWVIA